METDLEQFKDLLEKFGSINYVRPEANLFQIISGSESHYEKFVSNTLAFFLDAKESHGLGTLLLDALLEAAKLSGMIPEYGDYTVERERVARCGSDKYIDIFIASDTAGDEDKIESDIGDVWAMVIENKLFAKVYNPLSCYCNEVKRYISSLGGTGSKEICILLTMDFVEGDLKGFKNVTYSLLGDVLRKMLNPFDYPNTIYTQLLVELFDHVENMKRRLVMDKEVAKLLWGERQTVRSLLASEKEVRKSLLEIAKNLDKLIYQKLQNKYNDTLPYGWALDRHGIWQGYWKESLGMVVFYDFVNKNYPDCKIAFDIILFLNGSWELYVFSRKNKDQCNSTFYHILSEDATPNEKGRYLLHKGSGSDFEIAVGDVAVDAFEKISALFDSQLDAII